MNPRIRPGRRRAVACDGIGLRSALEAATSWLAAHASEVNSLNVFPVPDGDTGTNMLLTMKATVAAMASVPEHGASAVAQAMAHGALMGARGNSGVILSQILRGLARGLTHDAFEAPDLVEALRHAAETAYNAVNQPVEGTILTVIREVAESASDGGGDLVSVLERAVVAARAAVAKTPSLLAVLKEAGVVDAGGQGLYYLFDGALRYARGEDVEAPAASEPAGTGADVAATIDAHRATFAGHVAGLDASARYGYCTEFVIQGRDLDVDALRSEFGDLGDSLLVVGDPCLARVHLHTFDPGKALSLAIARGGSLRQIKIDNMQDQREVFVPPQEQPAMPTAAKIGVVAVAAGPGLRRVLESLGASRIVPGGQTMNPSTEALLQAIQETGSEEVIVLPNNKNVVSAAEQAAQLAKNTVRVVPTRSFPEGVAALLAFNPEASLEDNLVAMLAAIRNVRTGEITRAVRSTSVDGIPVMEGQVIGIVDGRLATAGDDLASVLSEVLERMGASSAELVTLYFGETVAREEAESIARVARKRFPHLTIELIDGGQPHYAFVLSAE